MERKPLPQINITALVDVLLVLVIILILAMPMFVQRLPVNLPKAAVDGAPVMSKSLIVSLNKNGQVFVDNGVVTRPVLYAMVTPQTTVEIAADKDVPYEKVTQLVAELQAKQPKDISLIVN